MIQAASSKKCVSTTDIFVEAATTNIISNSNIINNIISNIIPI